MKKNVNLLPPAEQKQFKLETLNYTIANFGVWILLSLVVFVALLFMAQLLLDQRVEDTTKQVNARYQELQNLKLPEVQKEIEILNKNLANFQKLEAVHEVWSSMLIEFARLVPSDLTVDSILITRKDNKIEISGHGLTRKSVLELRENLLSSSYFQFVNFPLSNLEKARDVSWKYRFYFNEEKLTPLEAGRPEATVAVPSAGRPLTGLKQ